MMNLKKELDQRSDEDDQLEKQFDATGGTSGMDVSGLMNEVRAEDEEGFQDEYQEDEFLDNVEVDDSVVPQQRQ